MEIGAYRSMGARVLSKLVGGLAPTQMGMANNWRMHMDSGLLAKALVSILVVASLLAGAGISVSVSGVQMA